jgi:hypothetical protein
MTDTLIDIGTLRRKLFMPYDCSWNGLVRDVTAKYEQSGGLVPADEVQSQLNRHCALLMQVKEIVAAASPQAPAPQGVIEAATELLDVMETCHICKGALILEEHPVHCEDCSGDCENHDEPECTPIYVLHARLRKTLAAPGASPGLERIAREMIAKFNLEDEEEPAIVEFLSRSLEGRGGELDAMTNEQMEDYRRTYRKLIELETDVAKVLMELSKSDFSAADAMAGKIRHFETWNQIQDLADDNKRRDVIPPRMSINDHL